MDDSMINLPASSGIKSKYSGGIVQTKDEDEGFNNGSLDFDGYLKLLVAQMSNQDFNDPMSDADLLNQMAQYSMLEGIKDMTQQSAISYAASLVGKVVTVSDGNYYHTGCVDSVNVDNGKASIIIDGESFESSKITDIVNSDAYNSIKDLVGKTVKIKGAGEDANTGTVTDVVFVNGQGWVAVGGRTYTVSQIEVVEDTDDENKTEGETGETDKTGETDETGGTGEAGETDKTGETGEAGEAGSSENDDDKKKVDDEYALENGQVIDNKAASYAASSEALADLLMKELDRVDAAKEVNAASEQNTEDFNLGEIMKTAHVNVPEFASVVSVDDDMLILSAVDERTNYANGDSSVSGVGNVSLKDYESATGTGTIVDDRYTETMPDSNSVSTSYANTYTSPYTASGRLRGVTAPAGIATSDGVPHRVSVEKYPEEAALADELGTRMYDIRYIHNHEITSRIKEGPIVARTASGRGVTEVGYSGVGQLGEVITFEDGTQRVEILLKSGKSTWLYTSGKYTLDQICNKNGAPGSLSNITGAEKAIRYYSDPYNRRSGSTILSQM